MATKKLKQGVWSKDEVRRLKKEFPRMASKEVAAELGRSCASVKKKASRLQLRKTKKYLRMSRCKA